MTASLGLEEVLAGLIVAFGGTSTSGDLGSLYRDLIAAVNTYTAGHQGTQGHQGHVGFQGGGLQGSQGAVGSTGAQGTQGLQGAQGFAA